MLDGTYRIDYDFLGTTTNIGLPNLSTANAKLVGSAFRSACNASGAPPAARSLDPANHQEAKPLATVLHFENGRWKDVPLTSRIECGTSRGPSVATVNPKDEFRSTTSLELEPLPDGTLKGVSTQKMESNECGLLGYVNTIPIVATRMAMYRQRHTCRSPAVLAIVEIDRSMIRLPLAFYFLQLHGTGLKWHLVV